MKIKSIVLFFTISVSAFAQDPVADTSLWLIDGYGGLNLNQVSFTNWAQGGDNSISFSLIGLLQANYHRDRHRWDNLVSLQYGLLYTKEFGMRKNEDKLELQTKYGYDLTNKGKLFLAFLLNYKSQFAKGYNYPDDVTVISRFNSPGYLTLSLGLDYKPVEYFSLFVSPITGRILFVSDDDIAAAGTYGNDPGENVRFEFGAYLAANFQKEIFKNVTLMSKLELFNDYIDETSRKHIDVNWETALLLKVNEWLAVSLTGHLIYDHDILIPDEDGVLDDRVQFKQALSIGLTYKFNNKREE